MSKVLKTFDQIGSQVTEKQYLVIYLLKVTKMSQANIEN